MNRTAIPVPAIAIVELTNILRIRRWIRIEMGVIYPDVAAEQFCNDRQYAWQIEKLEKCIVSPENIGDVVYSVRVMSGQFVDGRTKTGYLLRGERVRNCYIALLLEDVSG